MPVMSTIAIGSLIAAQTYQNYSAQQNAAKDVRRQGDYEAGILEQNATVAERQAQDALERGVQGANNVRRSAKILTGSQRAVMAASGVDIGVGSARDVVENDQLMSEVEQALVTRDAALQAWGFKMEASGLRQQGDMARAAGVNAAKNLRRQSYGTLLAGASQLMGLYRAPGPKRTYGLRAANKAGNAASDAVMKATAGIGR